MILGQNFHISIKSVFSEIRPGNDVWQWCRVCTRSSLPYMEISNFDGSHLGFFAKGFTHDFGSKCHISSKSVYSEIRPGHEKKINNLGFFSPDRISMLLRRCGRYTGNDVEGLNGAKCNKVLNVITFCPKCNRAVFT